MTGIAQVGQYSNTAVITGTPTVGPATPVTDSDPSHYFGPELDLALDKITIYNQGNVSADNILVADYVPAGFTLSVNDGNGWSGTNSIVSNTIVGPLMPSMTASLDIMLTADMTLAGSYTNTAEIADYTTTIKDDNGDDLVDVDSTPDATDDARMPRHGPVWMMKMIMTLHRLPLTLS